MTIETGNLNENEAFWLSHFYFWILKYQLYISIHSNKSKKQNKMLAFPTVGVCIWF